MGIEMIFKNQLRKIGIYIAILIVSLSGAAYLDTLSRIPFFAILSVLLLLAFILSTVMLNERYEDKNNGYSFLRVLPVKVTEIVAVKFVFMLVVVFIGIGLFIAAQGFLVKLDTPTGRIQRGFAYLVGNLGLLLVGLVYIGIYALGFMKMTYVARIGSVVFLLIPQILAFTMLRRGGEGVDVLRKIAHSVGEAPWALVSVCVVVLYFALIPIASILLGRRAA